MLKQKLLAEIEPLVQEVAAKVIDCLAEDIRLDITDKLMRCAEDLQRHRWATQEVLNRLINEAVEKQLATTFAPVIDEIAKEKAANKVRERAKKSNVEVEPQIQLALKGEQS